VEALNLLGYIAGAKFGDKHIANVQRVAMSEFGTFDMVFCYEVLDAEPMRFRWLDMYLSKPDPSDFFRQIMPSARVFLLKKSHVDMTFSENGLVESVKADIESDKGFLRRIDLVSTASHREYSWGEGTVSLEGHFGRKGFVEDYKHWSCSATVSGDMELDGVEGQLQAKTGSIYHGVYLYWGPYVPGTHRSLKE